MEIQVRGNGVRINDGLREFIDRRATRLDRMIDRVVDAKLELRARHNRSGPDTTSAQLTIQTGRQILRAEEDDPDPRVAIDRAVDKLHRQVRRFHDKRSDRKGPRLQPAPVASDGVVDLDASDPDLDLDEPDRDDAARDRLVGLVRTKRFSLKPMDIDEAIEQMELLGHNFFVFYNADDGSVNVVYRRQTGDYGLIIPELD